MNVSEFNGASNRQSANAVVLDPQNLLRTLTASQVKTSSDLKLLLNTVKEGRVSTPNFFDHVF
jgi:hypothetical protein